LLLPVPVHHRHPPDPLIALCEVNDAPVRKSGHDEPRELPECLFEVERGAELLACLHQQPQRLVCPPFACDVHADADHRGRLPGAIADHHPSARQPPQPRLLDGDAVLHVQPARFEGGRDRLLDGSGIFRMHLTLEGLEAAFEGPRRQAVDALEALTPRDTATLDVPVPGAHIRRREGER
jgi:hypothetical protein